MTRGRAAQTFSRTFSLERTIDVFGSRAERIYVYDRKLLFLCYVLSDNVRLAVNCLGGV